MGHRPRTVLIGALLSFTLLLPFIASASGPPEFDLATRRTMSGDHKGAIDAYLSFLRENPDDRLAPVAAAAVASLQLEALGDSAAALASYERIIERYPETEWALVGRWFQAVHAERRGAFEAAGDLYRELFRHAVRSTESASGDWVAEVARAAVRCYEQGGMTARVEELYREILADRPSPEVAGMALYALGELYEATQRGEAAAQAYAELVTRYPTSQSWPAAMGKRELIDHHHPIAWGPYLAYAEGADQIRSRDLESALRTCEVAGGAEASPELRECSEWRRISIETTLSGDYVEGCREARRFLAAHPDGPRSDLARRTLEESWSPVAEMQEEAARQPDDMETLASLGQAYAQAGAWQAAIGALARADSLGPADDTVQLTLGQAYIRTGRIAEARDLFQAYLERQPEDTMIMNQLGYLFLQQGETEEAIRMFERYAAQDPEDPNSHDSLGEGYLNAGRLEDASRQYEMAVQIDPEFQNSWFMLGRVYAEMGRPEEATRALERFLDLVPEGPQAEQARAVLESLGQGE